MWFSSWTTSRSTTPPQNALLEGRLGSGDAPPELRDAALLVRAARGPADAADEVCEPQLLASLVAASVPATVVEGRFGRRRGHTLPPKVAAAAAVFALLGGGVAAAATGSLPGPIQSRVASALAHVGMSVPHPGQTDSPHSPATSVPATGAASTRPSAYVTGLCTAYAASQQRVGGTTVRATVPDAVRRGTARGRGTRARRDRGRVLLDRPHLDHRRTSPREPDHDEAPPTGQHALRPAQQRPPRPTCHHPARPTREHPDRATGEHSDRATCHHPDGPPQHPARPPRHHAHRARRRATGRLPRRRPIPHAAGAN